MKKLLVIFLSLMAIAANAQDTKLVASAPYEVGVGQHFQLKFTANDSVGNFRWPADKNEDMGWMEVLIGPSTSTSISYKVVNGKETTSRSITYTYRCTINKKGAYALPPASAKDRNGKICKSKPLPILVGDAVVGKTPPDSISADTLFVTAVLDKDSVVLGDSLTLTFQVYWSPDIPLTNINTQGRPDVDACYMAEWPLPQQRNTMVVTYQGKAYCTVVWEKYTLVPLKTGTMVISPKSYDCFVREYQTFDPFDPFQNNFSEIKKQVSSPQCSFTVYEK